MTIRDLLNIFAARYKLIVAVWLFVIVATLVLCLLMPSQYKGTAAVVVDVKSPDPIAGMMLQGMTAPAYMATQVDIINSPRVAKRVVAMVGADEDSAIRDAWMEATDGRGTVADWFSGVLRQSLDVKPSRESNVIEISYYSTSPEQAALLANTFARAYIDTNIELRVDPAKVYADWFEQQGKLMRDRLEQAKQRLSAYQQEKGIVVFSDERLNYENSKLMELQSQLVMVEAQQAEASSKQKFGGRDTLADVMQSPVVSQLKADLARAEARLQERAGNLGVNHPAYRSQANEVDALRRQINIEISRVTASLETRGQVSKQNASELRQAIETHKQALLKMQTDRNEVSVLQQEVDAAQRAFDAVNTRQMQSNLESQSNQTNVSVLTAAVAPLNKARPRTLLSLLVAGVMGFLLGCAIALLQEFRNRRVYVASDIYRSLGIPVISIIPSSGARPLSATALLPLQAYPKLLSPFKGGGR